MGVFEYSLRFPGQQYDTVVGLHYNYFRDYDPAVGRYVESDPIGLSAGVTTFSYVGSAPLTYSDRMGLMTDEMCCARAIRTNAHVKKSGGASGGIVYCCEGRKVACVTDPIPDIRFPWSTGGRILNSCIRRHEERHFPHVMDCQPCAFYRPDSVGGTAFNNGYECQAYKAERRCLRESGAGCGTDSACGDWVRRRFEQVVDQIANQCARAGFGF